MKQEDVTYFKDWFSDYVSGYYTDDLVHDQPIGLKQRHTERVCKEIVMLGQALNLSTQDMLLAETMALFHDVGRFEQYASHNTFRDSSSEDHAELGVKELTKYNVLANCTAEERSLITKAIGYHNVRKLPDDKDESERTLFFARLLRDADKLDIWRVFIDCYERQDPDMNSTIVLGLSDMPAWSPVILDALRKHGIADLTDMTTLNDFKLLQISWVYDVSYGPTFGAVQKRRYVERIAAHLPQTDEILQVLSIVKSYLKKQAST